MANYMWDNLFKKNTKNKISQVLKECYLFKDLSLKELNILKNIVNLRTYQPGESVFKQGSVGVGMYIVLSGCIDVYIEDPLPGGDESENNQAFVTRLNRGDFFGELALVEDKNRRTATASAGEETQLIGFFKPGLSEISERRPATGVKILYRLSEILGRRLKETSVKITDLKRQIERIRSTK